MTMRCQRIVTTWVDPPRTKLPERDFGCQSWGRYAQSGVQRGSVAKQFGGVVVRGSVAWQTEEFWRAVDRINDGDQRGHVSSKFSDKQRAYAELDARGESRASSNVKNSTGIYSCESKKTYVSFWQGFGNFCKHFPFYGRSCKIL